MSRSKPFLMGVLNVTPDSFSDGGQYFSSDAAIARGLQMVQEGADLIDVGGESTRPGAAEVSADEELQRVLPVIVALSKAGIKVSIDTYKPLVAEAALKVGAQIVNDVTGLRNPEMTEICVRSQCTVCIMHMQGEPRTMQLNPEYNDVVGEVSAYLVDRAERAIELGVARDRIWIDPGIGFGKSLEHNLLLLNHLDQIVAIGFPVLVGVSRKSFIGKITAIGDPHDRLPGTLAAQVIAQEKGVRIVRAHDVKEASQAIDVAHAILSA